MSRFLISAGLLVVMSTGCASEEAWVKRRDAIRAHKAEQVSQQPQTEPATTSDSATKPAPAQG